MSRKQKKESEFIIFARHELDLLGNIAMDDAQMRAIKISVIPLCKTFEETCRIGGPKAKIVLRLFAKLASWCPLTPLTGADDEWEMIKNPDEIEDNDILYQNKRCPHVYKRKNGTAFDSEGIVFSTDGKIWYRTSKSNVNITFPYDVPVKQKRVLLDS